MTGFRTRLSYFAEAIFREYMPGAGALAAWHWRQQRPEEPGALSDHIQARVAYYNQLDETKWPTPSKRLGDLSFSQMPPSYQLYYIDLLRHTQGFGPDLRLDFVFGDVTKLPPTPAFVKSRPILEDRRTAVLMPLDRLRHFHFPKDRLSWQQKKPAAVWRGRINGQAPRRAAVMRHGTAAQHDIGHVCDSPDLPPAKGWLSIADQLRYRYVLSLEGHDVATNLKWIMGSNSVALSPPLRFETWFMEGRLEPGTHFIEIAPDMSDLDDVIAWCEANPAEVKRIVGNANAWVRQFADASLERLIARLVVQKYAKRLGKKA